MAFSIKGKKILVVGGAGKIGESITEEIHLSGGIPIVADANQKGINDISQKISKNIYSFKCEINNVESIKECLKKANSFEGEIDSVVYASYPKSKGWGSKFEELNEESLKENIFMQLGLPILFSRYCLDYFTSKGSGQLILLSSIQGIRAPKFDHYENTDMTSPIEYSAIKSGIISMTGWLAKYYKGKNVRINCISPGGIEASQPMSFKEKYKKDCLNIGLLRGKHIASLVVYLISDDSFAINGQNLIVDDGWSL